MGDPKRDRMLNIFGWLDTFSNCLFMAQFFHFLYNMQLGPLVAIAIWTECYVVTMHAYLHATILEMGPYLPLYSGDDFLKDLGGKVPELLINTGISGRSKGSSRPGINAMMHHHSPYKVKSNWNDHRTIQFPPFMVVVIHLGKLVPALMPGWYFLPSVFGNITVFSFLNYGLFYGGWVMTSGTTVHTVGHSYHHPKEWAQVSYARRAMYHFMTTVFCVSHTNHMAEHHHYDI